MSDEQFEAEWAMIDQLGLVVEDEVDGDDA
jgi:hypothetical protein